MTTAPAPDHAYAPVTDALLAAITDVVGVGGLSVAAADRALHARDQSAHAPGDPAAVVWPSSAEQVAAVLRLAHQARVPVTPWGVGTSLEGNSTPLFGGLVLSLARMNAIVAVHADDFQVTVQPGITHRTLNAALARTGLFFPPDPGADATIGGMLANNASGTRTVKYGASKDNVLAMQVALADGRLIRVGSRSVKQASGYNLLQLFVGSEGTLGVIVEATLRLTPVPAHQCAVVAAFPSVEAAVEAVVAVRGSGLDPAALEFMDDAHTRMLIEADELDLLPAPTLFMAFHAAQPAALEHAVAAASDICHELGALRVEGTTVPTEFARLWRARHHSYEIMVRAHPDQQFYIMDVAVPISAYPALIAFAQRTLADQGARGYLLGHAGDGNIHVELPHHDADSYARAMRVNRAIVMEALALGGTSTGEHGVGVGKMAYMADEHGAALDVMRGIKALLDPHNILNPGKVLPTAAMP